MARRNAAVHIGRASRQAQCGLGDVARRVGQQCAPEVFNFGLRRGRPDQHAVATGAVHFFDHQVFQVGQRVLEIVVVATHVGRHVLKDRFFAQVKLDHLGHVGVDRLVVGHAGANGVAQRHIAAAVHIQEAGATQRGLGPESQRV